MKKRVLFAAPLCALVILSAVAWPAWAPHFQTWDDLTGNYSFRVEIDGVDHGRFNSVNGLSAELEVIEYQDPGDPVLRKRPGRVKYGDITLKRGYISNSELWDWMKRATDDQNLPRSGVVIELLDGGNSNQQQPGLQWQLSDCFPSRWTFSEENGPGGPRYLVEELTLSCDTLVLDPGRN